MTQPNATGQLSPRRTGTGGCSAANILMPSTRSATTLPKEAVPALHARSRRLASALKARGVRKGDTVATMLSNTPPMLEAHHGVPMLGAVLNTLNTRLDAAAIAFMLEHGGAKVLLTDREFAATIRAALALTKKKPLVIDYDDPEFPQTGERLGEDYERLMAEPLEAARRRLNITPATIYNSIPANVRNGAVPSSPRASSDPAHA